MNTSNYSFYAVPAAWVLSIVPHLYAISVHDSNSKAGKFDNTQPRSLTKKIESDQTLDKATKDHIIRAEGAQQNGFENIGLFAAAVVAGNIAGLPFRTLNLLSGGYLASRIVYNLVYINNTTPAVAASRSGVYLSGVGIIMTLFIMSGNALNKLVL
jgi:uncharacterized MAPEG superfamily protein